MFIETPLKKIGFHINKGVMPHFKKIQKIMINQQKPNVSKFLRELEVEK